VVGSFGILWLLSAFNVLLQKYGVLLGLGLVVVLGALIPFVEGGFRKLDGLARERLASQDPTTANLSVPPPPPTTATAPPAPKTIPLPELDPQFASAAEDPAPTKAVASAESKGPAPIKAALADRQGEDAGVVSELVIAEPDPNAGKVIRVNEDVKVVLDGRTRVIRAGTVAPFKKLEDGQVTFVANGHEVSIDFGLVTFTGASKEKPEQITKLAQQEAVRRYPKLGLEDSRENILFVTRVKEIQLSPEKTIVFNDPKWPLVIAEQLAEQEGWRRADEPDPASEPAIPENEKPAAPSNDPAVPGAPGAAPAPAPAPASEPGTPAGAQSEPLLPEPSPVPEQASEPPPAPAR
jgi:hypothetical protein